MTASVKTNQREHAMTNRQIGIEDLKAAIESRNAAGLIALYADDAVMRIIDRDNPPSRPRELKGRPAIAAFYDDVCSRAMTHEVENGVSDGRRLAFTQACAYPDGTRVFCSAMIETADGRITRQTNVQAWDA
jgi:ketosteroid isomerase-like protein